MVSTKSLLSRLALLTMALAVAPVAVWSQVLDTSREVTFTAASGKSTFAFRWNKGMIFSSYPSQWIAAAFLRPRHRLNQNDC
jgi:hypothetical protein